jgi:hypothetical protein
VLVALATYFNNIMHLLMWGCFQSGNPSSAVQQINYASRARALSLFHKQSTRDMVVLRQRITRQQNVRSPEQPTAGILLKRSELS